MRRRKMKNRMRQKLKRMDDPMQGLTFKGIPFSASRFASDPATPSPSPTIGSIEKSSNAFWRRQETSSAGTATSLTDQFWKCTDTSSSGDFWMECGPGTSSNQTSQGDWNPWVVISTTASPGSTSVVHSQPSTTPLTPMLPSGITWEPSDSYENEGSGR